MRFRGGEFSTGTMGNFQPELTRGIKMGYGITSGLWDVVFHTGYPRPVRQSLFEKSRGARPKKLTRSEASRLLRERFQKQ